MSEPETCHALRCKIADLTDECKELRALLLLARAEVYHVADCVPGEPCRCENGELMRRMDAALGPNAQGMRPRAAGERSA